MKYRSNIEVMGQILQIANCSNNAKKNKIKYKAFFELCSVRRAFVVPNKKGPNYDVNT